MSLLLETPVSMADMAILLDNQLSANLGKTPEGYLVCKDVPIARTGIQRYLGQEIGLQNAYNKMFDVHRLPDEVFSKDTLASLEGKPVTAGHPPGNFLAPENWNAYAKGHAQNIRKMGDYIVADLVITDPTLISQVENKVMRQVSVGYQCYYAKHEDSFKQIQIRGNHIAIVPQGRAGEKVAVKDEKPKGKTMKTNQVKMEVLKALVTADASPDVLEQALSMFDAEPVKTEVVDNEPKWFAKLVAAIAPKSTKDDDSDEKKEDDEDEKKTEDRLSKIEDTLTKIAKRLTRATDEDEDKKDLEEALKSEDEEMTPEEMAAVDEDKEDDDEKKTEDKAPARQAVLALAKDLKPFIAKLPAKDQAMVKDRLAKAMGSKTTDKKTYGEIQKIVQKTAAQGVHDSQDDGTERGKKIAAARNPHYKPLQAVQNK